MYNAGEPVKRNVFMYAYTCVSYTPVSDQEPRKREINLSSTGHLQINNKKNENKHELVLLWCGTKLDFLFILRFELN